MSEHVPKFSTYLSQSPFSFIIPDIILKFFNNSKYMFTLEQLQYFRRCSARFHYPSLLHKVTMKIRVSLLWSVYQYKQFNKTITYLKRELFVNKVIQVIITIISVIHKKNSQTDIESCIYSYFVVLTLTKPELQCKQFQEYPVLKWMVYIT